MALQFAIVMSRGPRLITPEAPWIRALRAALRRIKQLGGRLLIADGTAHTELIRYGATRLGIPLDALQVGAGPDALVSSPLSRVSSPSSSLSDEALIDQADQILVLRVRPEGNIYRLLTSSPQRSQKVTLVRIAGLHPDFLLQELYERGAKDWEPTVQDLQPLQPEGTLSTFPQQPEPRPFPDVYSLCSLIEPGEWSYLTHTTRACPGPWPGQSQEDYFGSLLDGRPDADHSTLGTLLRIVLERRLRGSSRMIRGGYKMVSLTAVAWNDLPGLRCFRTQHSRWDFEPFGLCIRRSVLQHLGAREVVYGSEKTWAELPPRERPFFQLSHLENQTDKSTLTDWSAEQEWRIPGDLDLTRIDPSNVTVFVPTFDAARQILPHSPWPVTLWPGNLT